MHSRRLAKKAKDKIWNERFEIIIGPHPDLGPNQKTIITEDYGMKNGSTVLKALCTMLFYVLKRNRRALNISSFSTRKKRVRL